MGIEHRHCSCARCGQLLLHRPGAAQCTASAASLLAMLWRHRPQATERHSEVPQGPAPACAIIYGASLSFTILRSAVLVLTVLSCSALRQPYPALLSNHSRR